MKTWVLAVITIGLLGLDIATRVLGKLGILTIPEFPQELLDQTAGVLFVVSIMKLVPAAAHRLGFRRKPPRKLQPDVFGVRHGQLRYRFLMVAMGVALSILFFWVAYTDFLVPTHQPTLIGQSVRLLIAFLGLYFVWAAILSFVYKVEYSSTSITVTGYLFQPLHHDWANLVKIDSGWVPESSRLLFDDSGTALISDYVDGRDEILNFAQDIIDNARTPRS